MAMIHLRSHVSRSYYKKTNTGGLSQLARLDFYQCHHLSVRHFYHTLNTSVIFNIPMQLLTSVKGSHFSNYQGIDLVCQKIVITFRAFNSFRAWHRSNMNKLYVCVCITCLVLLGFIRMYVVFYYICLDSVDMFWMFEASLGMFPNLSCPI